MKQKKYIYFLILFFQFLGNQNVFAQKDSLLVYIFLSDVCPICQNQTITLKELVKEYEPRGVRFVGIFPNISTTTKENTIKFWYKYKLNFEVLLDENQLITNELGAKITPEVFVLKKSNREILYKGKIDNGFERVGKRRQVITENYLKDALEILLKNDCQPLTNTEAVGCFIIRPTD